LVPLKPEAQLVQVVFEVQVLSSQLEPHTSAERDDERGEVLSEKQTGESTSGTIAI
jgi:hypothetical protein